MNRHQRTLWISPAIVAMTLVIAGPRIAVAAEDALIVYSAGLEQIFVDEKDQALATALRLVSARVAELPQELDNPMIPVPAIQLVYDLFTSPMLIRAGMLPDADPMGGAPFYAQINFMSDDPAEAQSRAQRFGQMAQMAPAPSLPAQDAPGFEVIDLNGLSLYHGVLQPDGPASFVVALNKLHPEFPDRPELGLPPGVRPALALKFDAAAVRPFIEMMVAKMGPQGDMVRAQLEMYGLLGPEPTALVMAMGHGPDRTHGVLRYTNYVQLAERQGTLVREPLTRQHLSMIPVDATAAEIGRVNFGAYVEMIRQMSELQGQMGGEMAAEDDPIEMIAQEIGFHLEHDLTDHLGQTFGFYMSDATGGGGLFSSVVFVELSNPAGLSAALDKLVETVNALAKEHAKGYVQMRAANVRGHDLMMLTFPGLPVPLEISCAIQGNYFFAGLSPHAVVAAINQAKGDRPSLLDNPGFQQMGGDNWQGAMQVSFTDTPRLARAGYGLTSLLCAAISNAVRSPTDPQRDPGIILPSFHDLIAGAKPATSFYRLDGNDLVVTAQADRSVLVNLAGGLGVLGEWGAPVAALVGTSIVIPSIGKAQEKARQQVSLSNIQQMSVAMWSYAADHADAAPPNLEALAAYMQPELGILPSPFGPVLDGRGDYWMNTSHKLLSECRYPNLHLAFYDRAMYANFAEAVAVGFYDGHVQVLDLCDYLDLTKRYPNTGTGFDLPGAD